MERPTVYVINDGKLIGQFDNHYLPRVGDKIMNPLLGKGEVVEVLFLHSGTIHLMVEKSSERV